MIKAISFKNFKSFKNEINFEIKPITLIYGLNGSGKSSILQILQLLKQSLENSNEGILLPKVNSDDSIDLGSYEEFIYQHKKTNNLEVSFHGNIEENYISSSIRNKISTINREKIDFFSKNLKIKKIIKENQVIKNRDYSIKIIFNLDKNSNIHQRKIIVHLDNRLLLEVDRGANDKDNILTTKKYFIDEKENESLLNHLKTKTNKEIRSMICTFNNKKLILNRTEAIILKWIYLHCKKNKTNKIKYGLNVKKFIKLMNLLDIKELNLIELIKQINQKFKEHPSIRKEFKAIKFINDEKTKEKNTIFWDIDFQKTNLEFFLDPEIKNVTYKDVLISDFELAIDLQKNRKQWNYDSVYRSIDPNFPFNSVFNRQLLNNENNISSIINFISDLKKKKLTKKLLKESIENNFANKFWKEQGFLIKKDNRSGGFSTLTGEFRGYLGSEFDSVIGTYLYDKIRLHNENYKNNLRRRTNGPDNIFNDINLINNDIRDFLGNIFHLAPQAIKVPRINTFKGTTPNNVGQSGTNMPDLLFKNNLLLKKCNETLKELKIPYEINVETLSRINQEETGLYELRVLDKITKTNVQVSDTGYGISQLITFMVHLIYSKNNQITMKEELEAHLHPSWQIKLPNLIYLSILDSNETMDIVKSKSNMGQKWILETHSEHLILKLKKMIKEKQIKHNSISIYYAYKDKKSSSSKLDKIELDENGKFIGKWRDGFFQERIDLI